MAAIAAHSASTLGADRVPAVQRSVGDSRLAFKRRGAATVLDDLYQSGCAKIRLPALHDRRVPEAVLINTAGGLTGGDRLTTRVAWAPGTCATVTSQAAERIYKSPSGPATIRTELSVANGATALWLPQETIFFDGGSMNRLNTVELGAQGRFLAVETVVFGRTAMGETVHAGFVADGWRVRHDGRLVFADGFRIDGAISDTLARPAVAARHQAMATVLRVGADAPGALDDWRARLADLDVTAGCSAIGPVLIARFVAKTGDHLRRDLVRFLSGTVAAFAPDAGAALPRVWAF